MRVEGGDMMRERNLERYRWEIKREQEGGGLKETSEKEQQSVPRAKTA